MRYRVEFRYREDTGEVEVLQVDAMETGQRAVDHDEQHDRVASELASVVEQYAVIEEISDPAAAHAQPAMDRGLLADGTRQDEQTPSGRPRPEELGRG